MLLEYLFGLYSRLPPAFGDGATMDLAMALASHWAGTPRPLPPFCTGPDERVDGSRGKESSGS